MISKDATHKEKRGQRDELRVGRTKVKGPGKKEVKRVGEYEGSTKTDGSGMKSYGKSSSTN